MNGLIKKASRSCSERAEREGLQCDRSSFTLSLTMVLLFYVLCFLCPFFFSLRFLGESLSATSESAGSVGKRGAAKARGLERVFRIKSVQESNVVCCSSNSEVLTVVVCVLFWTGLTEVNINNTDSAFNSHFEWNSRRILGFSVPASVPGCHHCPIAKHDCGFLHALLHLQDLFSCIYLKKTGTSILPVLDNTKSFKSTECKIFSLWRLHILVGNGQIVTPASTSSTFEFCSSGNDLLHHLVEESGITRMNKKFARKHHG